MITALSRCASAAHSTAAAWKRPSPLAHPCAPCAGAPPQAAAHLLQLQAVRWRQELLQAAELGCVPVLGHPGAAIAEVALPRLLCRQRWESTGQLGARRHGAA